MNNKLVGTGVALVTPFNSKGGIDFNAVGVLLDHIISGGVEYVVILGTTGESVTLTKEEKKELIAYTLEKNAGRIAYVLGIGGNNTQEILHTIESTDFKGIDAILSVSPYYNKPNQQGIFNHFEAVANASPVPVIAYNVPGRTGSNMSAALTIRIANEIEGIVAIKEASGNINQIMELIKDKPDDFMVISGDDNLTYPMMCLGASGVISVVAQAYPKQYSEMVRLCIKGNYDKALGYHYDLYDFVNYLFADGSPGGIKSALNIMGLCEEYVRMPLAPVNDQVRKLIHDFVVQYP